MNKTLLKLISYNDVLLYHSFRFIKFTDNDLIYLNTLNQLIFNYKQILKYQKLNNETIIKLFFDDDNQLANVSGWAVRAKFYSLSYLDENYALDNVEAIYILHNAVFTDVIHSEDFMLKVLDLCDKSYIFYDVFNKKIIKLYKDNKNIVMKLLEKDISLFDFVDNPSEEMINYYRLMTL